MTHPQSHEIEQRIIDSVRIHKRLKVDLSGVDEIDLSGTHLLGVLLSFDEGVIDIVATSPVTKAALAPLQAFRDAALRARTGRQNQYSQAC